MLNQHNPPLWSPKRKGASPMLWVAGEQDAVVSLKGARKSAAYYGADFMVALNAGHNLMMEADNTGTAQRIEAWLSARPGMALGRALDHGRAPSDLEKGRASSKAAHQNAASLAASGACY